MHVSCLLPGLYSSYFMLGQSAITRDSCRLRLITKWIKNRTQLEVVSFFFSRNISLSKPFPYVLTKTTGILAVKSQHYVS